MALVEALGWLLAPLSGATEHAIAAHVAWHGRLMVLSWGVLLPVGVLVARYFKVRRGQDWPRELDDPWWWHRHRLVQYTGIALMTVGAGLIWLGGAEPAQGPAHGVASWHCWSGWAVFALGWLQVAGAWARGTKGGPTDARADPRDPATWRGDHYDMTRHRIVFEWQHKAGGWVAIALACGTLVMGLINADAPRWMFGAIAGWWLLLAVLAVHWQRDGRRVDTWEAIWGPRRPDG